MNDTFNLATDNSTKIFYANENTWQTWQKPPNASLVSVFVIGGGAGGGSGGLATQGVTKNAGGGGGSSAYAYATYPAFAFPDIAYIQVGRGGQGATQGFTQLNGAAGSLSYVSAAPSSASSIDLILASGTTAPGGGNGGGGAGVAGTVFNLNSSFLSQMAMVSGAAGVAGGSGGNPGTSITPTLIITPGAGGGGCNSVGLPFTGGSINAYGVIPSVAGGAGAPSSGSTTPGSDGQRGLFYLNIPGYPMFFTGGAGGGAGGNSKGGRGGDGAYGCGGGGGGGGTTTAGNGGGGNGGDGLVIITCY